jgi:hypothetical protein
VWQQPVLQKTGEDLIVRCRHKTIKSLLNSLGRVVVGVQLVLRGGTRSKATPADNHLIRATQLTSPTVLLKHVKPLRLRNFSVFCDVLPHFRFALT